MQQTFAAVDAQTAELKAGKVRYFRPSLLNMLILACRTERARTQQTSKMKRMSTSSMTTRYVWAIFAWTLTNDDTNRKIRTMIATTSTPEMTMMTAVVMRVRCHTLTWFIVLMLPLQAARPHLTESQN